MNDIPAAKIRMMKTSIHCLIYGLLGLLPIIGLPFALGALWISGHTRLTEKQFWNPAKSYRICGVACAAIGAVVWSVVDMLLIYQAFNSYAA
jgi:hypothetical protein